MTAESGHNDDVLHFYFDIISHNAWLAWAQLPALCAEFGLQLRPVPVLFAGLLKAHGQRGPAEVLPKREWMLLNVLRKAAEHGIPISPPYSHPFNPLAALRVIAAAPTEHQLALTERLFRATWAESLPVHEPDCVRSEILKQGLDAESLMAAATTEAGKQRIRDNTEQALADGVFGVPSMRVRGQLFFGFDDLHYLRRFLAGSDPLTIDAAGLALWNGIRPSAQRKELAN